ncbi:energy-coupling factor ABC transporter substrate-binding protein [Listeria monocytogenes]|uniref:energy-coupling factor ABC transporter substrate-binding protein n=1 Tax=Listeria monocytogenes TaxID=1639 RepID=UPI000E6CBC3B|nr:energy-coupling factor ABC transporter substrate-binding protein [Listeria monocytogenes]
MQGGCRGEEETETTKYGASDGASYAPINKRKTGEDEWFLSPYEGSIGEIERLLFTLQACSGAVVIAYVIVVSRCNRQAERDVHLG